MGRMSGKEMRRLMLAVTLSTLVLVLAIIAYFMVDIVITTNENIESNKERMIQESVRMLSEMSKRIEIATISPEMMQLFNQDLINEVLSGDIESLYEDTMQILLLFYPVDYASIIVDGQLVKYDTNGGIVIDASEMPTVPLEGEYETLSRLGDKEGFFVSVFVPVDISLLGVEDMAVNMIVDRTKELADIENYFEDQRNDLILRLSIASIIAIILSLLLTTFGLRHFTRKYVVLPIEKLNRTAEEIADGTFEGEVKVDQDSAYAAIQGLLQSGQKVLRRMDEEIE